MKTGTRKHVQVGEARPRSGAAREGVGAAFAGLRLARRVQGGQARAARFSLGGQAGLDGEAGVSRVLPRVLPEEHAPVRDKIMELYTDLFLHDGFGKIVVEMRFLKRGQKEIIVSSGKDFRFVVDWPVAAPVAAPLDAPVDAPGAPDTSDAEKK